MIINLKAIKLDLTPAIREYIETKIGSLARFIKRFEPSKTGKLPARRGKKEIEAFVEICRMTSHHRKGDVFCVIVNIPIGKTVIRAEDIDWDVRIAVDKVKDRLQQEIKKYKEKHEIKRAKER